MNRRQVLRWAGQVSGGMAIATASKFLLTSCAGNVSTSTPDSNSTGEAQVSHQGLRTAGLLQWGAESISGAPYVFNDPANPNQLVGFEVEIAQAIAQLMASKQALVQTSYAQLSASLAANQFDMILNGWEVTSDREKTQLFSDPYYRYGQQIVVRADDSRFSSATPLSDLTLKDLQGMAVGTGIGYKAEEILRSDPKIKTRAYEGNLPFDDLRQKRLDAVLLDLPIVVYYVLGSGPGGTQDPALKLAGKPIYTNNYVIGFNKNSPKAQTLQAEINQALTILKQDGTLKGIYQRWQIWNDQQSEIGIV